MRFLSFCLSLAIVAILFPIQAYAEEWVLPVNPICCSSGYTVYGDEQPEFSGDACVVKMDPVFLTRGGATNTNFPAQHSLVELSKAAEFIGITGTPDGYVLDIFKGIGLSVFFGVKNIVNVFSVNIPQIWATSTTYVAWHIERANYHAFVNDLFAKALKRVMGARTDAAWKKLQEGSEKCTAKSLSSHCVAERLLCSYEKYQGVHFEVLRSTDVSNLLVLERLSEVLEADKAFKRKVLLEADYATQSMDKALKLYAQILETYRFHLKYKDMVASLDKTRSWTGHLYALFGCFPNKLLGTATTRCN